MCEFVVIQQILTLCENTNMFVYIFISVYTKQKVTSVIHLVNSQSHIQIPMSLVLTSEAAMNATLACIILRDSVLKLLLNLVPEELADKGLQECPQGIT